MLPTKTVMDSSIPSTHRTQCPHGDLDTKRPKRYTRGAMGNGRPVRFRGKEELPEDGRLSLSLLADTGNERNRYMLRFNQEENP